MHWDSLISLESAEESTGLLSVFRVTRHHKSHSNAPQTHSGEWSRKFVWFDEPSELSFSVYKGILLWEFPTLCIKLKASTAKLQHDTRPLSIFFLPHNVMFEETIVSAVQHPYMLSLLATWQNEGEKLMENIKINDFASRLGWWIFNSIMSSLWSWLNCSKFANFVARPRSPAEQCLEQFSTLIAGSVNDFNWAVLY